MADEPQSSSETERFTDQTVETQLTYPQLLIEASFDSLLTHSQSSGRTILPMPRSEHSLSESWSSLSEQDLATDDDAYSEATDTCSVHESEHVSDAEDSQDEAAGYHEGVRDRAQDYKQEHSSVQESRPQHTNPRPDESIELEESAVLVDARGMTQPQASKSFTETDLHSSSRNITLDNSSVEAFGTIKMPLARECLKQLHRPYHILYHGSAFCSPEIKPEVLGKIGAALISSSENQKDSHHTESPCFHVVPSEFGPGSKPSTADLIPIPTQIHVAECAVIESSTPGATGPKIVLQLSTGKRLVSRHTQLDETQDTYEWTRPDLVLVIVSQHDSPVDKFEASRIVEFANRHSIATICLRQEAGWGGDNSLTDTSMHMLHMTMQSNPEDEDVGPQHKMLLDVDRFLALDAEHISQHLNYLSETLVHLPRSRMPLANSLTRLRNPFSHCRFLPHSLAEMLSPGLTEDKSSSSWIVQTWEPQSSDLSQKDTHQEHKPDCSSSPYRTFVLAKVWQITLLVVMSSLAALTMYGCQASLSYLMSTKPPSIRGDLVQATSTMSFLPTTICGAAASTTTTQAHALSGPFHAIEQQVQSWIPLNVPRPKKDTRHQPQADEANVTHGVNVESCHDIVPAHIRPNFKVDQNFFKSGEPAFDVRVQRGNDEIAMKLKPQEDGTVVVLVKRKDLHGRLTVYLDGSDQNTCASINLEHSFPEALTKWIQNQKLRLRAAKKLANQYTRLLEIRTTKPGFMSTALELHYSATQGLGAVVEVVEKSAIKHAKVCHNNKEECFVHKLVIGTKDLSRPVQHARHVSEELIESTRRQISNTAQQARKQANEVTEYTREEISKAVHAVQSTIGELSIFNYRWPSKVTEKLSRAQNQAQRLVPKSGARLKKGRRSVKEL